MVHDTGLCGRPSDEQTTNKSTHILPFMDVISTINSTQNKEVAYT